MDFGFSPEEEAFRQEVRQFIKQELPPDFIGSLWFEDEVETDEMWEVSKVMAHKIGAKGWFSMGWPKEYGGQGRSHIMQCIFAQELAYNQAPGGCIQGARMLAPVLLHYGTEEQKRRHLPPIARGEIFWAQGFSEPEAGSDLAAVQTRAVEKDDHFIVDGQKIWASGAQYADWVHMLARTDPNVPKHKGLSYFLTDLKAPGITVRPLVNMLGTYSLNEIFFDGAKISKKDMIGEKNKGWEVTTALLRAERSGIERASVCQSVLDGLVEYVRERDKLAKNRLVQNELAERAVEIDIGKLLSYRVAWQEDKGEIPQAEAAMAKAYASELMQRTANTGMHILGLYGQLAEGSKWAITRGKIEHWYLSTVSRPIAGGTSEVQRNIIALRGLGLPRG
jgi:alkylation response protein AidB-like acyl-CoA dehydrogenase